MQLVAQCFVFRMNEELLEVEGVGLVIPAVQELLDRAYGPAALFG